MGFTLALRPERVYDRIELMIGAKRKPVGGNVALTRYRNVRTMPAFAGRGAFRQSIKKTSSVAVLLLARPAISSPDSAAPSPSVYTSRFSIATSS